MILILFLLFAPVASVSSEDYYIDNPEEYDDLSEDPWMDPHSAYTTTTTTTTTEFKLKCQKVCKKVCPTISTTLTTTTTTSPGK